MSFLLGLCMVLFLLVCVLLILIVLVQKGRGGGLASAFGGMGGNTAFGSKTGDVLTWATSVIFGVFVLLAVALNWLSNYRPAPTATAGIPAQSVPAPGTGSATPNLPSQGTPALPERSPATPAAPVTPAPATPAAPAPAR